MNAHHPHAFRFFLVILFLGSLVFGPGCSRHTGTFIRSPEEATRIVGTYQSGTLTEAQFLEDWPSLENAAGSKHAWAWGILETSSTKVDHQVGRSYALGYFKSTFTERTQQTGDFITVSDSTGVHIVPRTVERIIEEHWERHSVWRFDFQDSVLVKMEQIGPE